MRIRLDIPLFSDELASYVGAELPKEYCGRVIRFVSTDSRELSEGDLFVGLKGASYDGSDYASEAYEAGAIPLVAADLPYAIRVENTERAFLKIAALYKSKLKKLKCTVAITGSVGKSTTKEFLGQILGKSFIVGATLGNFNNSVGISLSVLSAPRGTEVLVLEMGMNNSGEISLMSESLNPDIAIITNVGSSHIGNLGSREAIAKAKLEVLCGMRNGILLYPYGEPLLKGHSGYSFSYKDTDADFCLTGSYDKVSFFKGDRWILNSSFHLKERHLLSCLAPAVTAALLIGVPVSLVSEAIDEISYVSIKQRFIGIGDFTVYSDLYNASKESLVAAFDFVSKTPGYKKRSALIGTVLELGEKSEEIHTEIGKAAAAYNFKSLFLFGEEAETLKRGAVSMGYPENRIFTTPSREDHKGCAENILREAECGELILFKGSRRMKLERIIDLLTCRIEAEKNDA